MITTKATGKTVDKAPVSICVTSAMDDVREHANLVSGALSSSSEDYVSGMVALGRAAVGIGRETATEFGQHAKAVLEARSIRDVAELQVGWVRHRIETATAQAKELADLTREKSEEVIEPFTALRKQDKAA
ncbi:MAG: phasin family protein [Paracoccus sp. (in: a-proteobacteria)]